MRFLGRIRQDDDVIFWFQVDDQFYRGSHSLGSIEPIDFEELPIAVYFGRLWFDHGSHEPTTEERAIIRSHIKGVVFF